MIDLDQEEEVTAASVEEKVQEVEAKGVAADEKCDVPEEEEVTKPLGEGNSKAEEAEQGDEVASSVVPIASAVVLERNCDDSKVEEAVVVLEEAAERQEVAAIGEEQAIVSAEKCAPLPALNTTMDRTNGMNQNNPPCYGSYVQFDGLYGSTVQDDEGLLRTAGDDGMIFSNFLTGQGVPQGWPSSQSSMGYSSFGEGEATMVEGGSSLRDPETAEETHTSKEPISQVRPKKACRSKNFSEKEDLLLVSAWINVGRDPIHGTNQSTSTYWGRITQYFHENSKGLITDRNQKSLTARWQCIQENVSKFCGWLSQVEGRNQSGTTQADKLDNARSLYESTENKKFHFMHCFHVLKDKAKWRNLVSTKKLKTGASSSPASRPDEAVYVDLEGQTTHTVHNESERLEGTKSAKRKSRTSSLSTWNENAMKETVDSMSIQFVESETRRQDLMLCQQEKHQQELVKRHEQLLASRREKITLLREIEEKKLQHKEKMKAMEIEQTEKLKAMEIELKDKHFRMELERRELNMIMQLDLTKLDDVSKKYYERRKMKLLAKAEEEE